MFVHVQTRNVHVRLDRKSNGALLVMVKVMALVRCSNLALGFAYFDFLQSDCPCGITVLIFALFARSGRNFCYVQ